MKNKIFGLTTTIALSMIAAGGLWAQGMGVSGWSSPQSTATQGRIRSAADDFIRPDSYTSARINDWFAMTSFASSSAVSLGYAKKLEKVYIGAYYGGTFWANVTPFTYEERKITWPDGDEKTVPVYGSLDFSTPAPSNRVAVLIGAADMGFRLSFYSTHESFSKSNFVGDGTPYKSYKQDLGTIRPQLAWSLTKNLTENGIKPYVTVDLDFYREYQKSEAAGYDVGETIGYSENVVQPIFQVGLGGYTFYTKEAFRLSADLEYRLTLGIYDNEYSYFDAGSGKYKTGKVKGLNTAGASGNTFTENSDISNLITPFLAAQWSGGPVALRGRLQLPVTIRSTEVTPVTLNGDKLEKNGTDTSTTAFGFAPSIQLALQWRPITKLAINAGGLISLNSIGSSTAKITEYANDKEVDDSFFKRVTETIPSGVSNQLTLGVTFNPTDYLFFEAASGIGANNKITVFSDDGIFSFGSVLVGLKF